MQFGGHSLNSFKPRDLFHDLCSSHCNSLFHLTFPFSTYLLQEFNFLLFGVENSQGLLMLQLQLLPPFSSLSHMLFQRKQKNYQETLTHSICSQTCCHSQACRCSSQHKRSLVSLVGNRETGCRITQYGLCDAQGNSTHFIHQAHIYLLHFAEKLKTGKKNSLTIP